MASSKAVSPKKGAASSALFAQRLLLIPVGLGLLFGIFNLLSVTEVTKTGRDNQLLNEVQPDTLLPAWTNMDYSLYDLFLDLKPPISQAPDLVLLNIDDEATTNVGMWPWPRARMAEGLEVLTELGARYAVFDIEYIDKSPRSVDQDYLDINLRTRFAEDFRDIKSSLYELLSALSQRNIGLADLPAYSDLLADQIASIQDSLYADVRRVAQENDSYLGQAMRLFGKSFITLNMQMVPVPRPDDPGLPAIARQRFAYEKVTGADLLWSRNKDFFIPIRPITIMAAGAGSTNVYRDLDGKLRRIRLLNRVDGAVYAQLALSPYLDSLGNPTIAADGWGITLKDALVDGKRQDIRIPLDAKGDMLINWPASRFSDSFLPPKSKDLDATVLNLATADGQPKQPSFYLLLQYKKNENELAAFLSALAGKDVWNLVAGKNPIRKVMALAADADAARLAALASGSAEDRAAYIQAKDFYYEMLQGLSASPLDQEVVELVREAQSKDRAANAALYETSERQFTEAFKTIRELIAEQLALRENLRKLVKDAYCVMGWTAIGSTDFGVTPFDEKYANVGTHTSVLNTIMQRQFLQEAPWWVSSLLGLVLAVGLVFLVQRMKTGVRIAVGIGATAATFLALFLVFMFTGVYILAVAPLLSVFLSFLVYILVVLFLTEKEKSYLRKAFSTYMSDDVIEQIVKDPETLKLGGQKKWISAMFTDVKGFSTVSEQLEPEQLVRLLNIYLSGMSDLILENRGTIDKFEGDAIIAFFGAPVDYDHHAEAVCRAAILMKRTEKLLNERFLAENLSPTPLLTRIGINTGDMVVGNMGTERKMDYTIMGNAVNLAARLEGVNKQYGSWILATEATKAETGATFAWRRLDRVRVVGINQPLRLYELVELAADLPAETTGLLADFDAALDLFEERRWTDASKAFQAIAERHPADGPCKTYLRRSREFQEKPPAHDWDGVFNLTEK